VLRPSPSASPSSVSIRRYLVNGSAPVEIRTLPTNVSFDGPSIVTVVFSPLFLLTVATTVGGTATPGSEWVANGQSVQLNATANVSYHFVGWSGGGAGATFGSVPNLTVRLAGPVTETATFAWNGPSLWTLHVDAVGLPVGTGFSVAVGNTSYSATGSFNVTDLTTGDYALSVPFAYSNSSALTRFAGTVTGSSLSFAGPSDLSISENGTLNLTFLTEYQVTYSATAGGTISPSPGSYWEVAGVPLPSSATAGTGYGLVGWVGAGIGSISSPSLTISAVAEAPITEVAQFVATIPPAPATYFLNVSETGLPNGVTWGLVVGLASRTGAGAILSISGLNGSYPVSIPTVSAGYGLRYVPTNAPITDEILTSDQTLSVAFQEQFWIGVSASAGGTAGPSSGWVNAGTSVTLAATPNVGWNFGGWEGSGLGSYTGNSSPLSFTPTGASNETAQFLPVQVASHAGSSSGAWLPIGLFVALVLVGGAVGTLLSRRPRRDSTAYEPTDTSSDSSEAADSDRIDPAP
jgi:Divergent InlB B-repeat domain